MSRIGRLPVPVPAGVEVTIDGRAVTVKGPKGILTHSVAEPIVVQQAEPGYRFEGRLLRPAKVSVGKLIAPADAVPRPLWR